MNYTTIMQYLTIQIKDSCMQYFKSKFRTNSPAIAQHIFNATDWGSKLSPYFEDKETMNRFVDVWGKKAPTSLLRILKVD